MNDVARIEMKDDDGAQAQAMQVRFRGRASLDGAPLHPLRPPASMLTVWLIVDNKIKGVTLCSHVPGRFTHTHTHSLTHSLTHTHTHATTHSLARSFAHSFLSHPRNRTIITVTQACTHKRTDAYTHTESHSRQQCARKPNRCILSCSPRATLPFSDLHFQACFPVCRPSGFYAPILHIQCTSSCQCATYVCFFFVCGSSCCTEMA